MVAVNAPAQGPSGALVLSGVTIWSGRGDGGEEQVPGGVSHTSWGPNLMWDGAVGRIAAHTPRVNLENLLRSSAPQFPHL